MTTETFDEARRIFAPALEDGPLTHYTMEEGRIPYRWVAQDSADFTPPQPGGRPEAIDSRHNFFGCGPEVEVDVRLPVQDSGSLLAQAELTPSGTTPGKPGAYLLPVVDGVVTIGHGMCSGAFRLQPGGEYRLHLEILDSAGNRARPWQEPLAFRAPRADPGWTRAALADALRRLRAAVPLEGAADHGVSEALYLRDPDGNGVELY